MKKKKVSPLDVRQHQVRMPEWMWNLAKEGAIATGAGCPTVYIRQCIAFKGDHDGLLGFYKKLLSKHRDSK